MKYLVVLRGIPGSGKSAFIERMGLKNYTLSSDEYRLRLSSYRRDITGIPIINQEHNAVVWQNLYADLEYRMRQGEFTIIDATHTTKKSFEKYRALCKKYFYRLVVITFNIDVDEAIINDRRRLATGEYVGEDVIRRMAEQMKEPLPNSIRQILPSQYSDYFRNIYRTLNISNYNKLHIIGDVHGCYTPMKEYFDNNVDEEKDAVIFVGDYFDRGIENFKVFDFVYNRLDKPNFFFLEGNHDRRIKKYLWGDDVTHTQFYNQTLVDFTNNGVTTKMLRKFCAALIPCADVYYKDTQIIVSHAGIVRYTQYENPVYVADDVFVKGIGTYEDMNKICNTFYQSSIFQPDIIQVFGHRNNNDVAIKINDKCYNVCGFPETGGDLKIVEFNSNCATAHYIPNNIFSKELYYRALVKYPHRYKITDVETLVEAFRHSQYVKENVYGNISSFNFTKDAFYEGIWNNITNRARGIFINTHTNKIVARSYDKFFLLNQYEYSTLDKFTPPFKIYEKYDGFLGILGYDEETDSLVFCSKSTIAPYGEFANLFKSKIEPRIKDTETLKNFLRTYNCSMIFECIVTKEDKHLIEYDSDMVVLLDIILNTIEYHKELASGETKTYYDIVDEYFSDVIVKEQPYNATALDNRTIHRLKCVYGEHEGYVIEDKNGKMFKLKTYTYEARKILRTITDTYIKIKEKAGGHEIKCPSDTKIEERYCKGFHPLVLDNVKAKIPGIIERINMGVLK